FGELVDLVRIVGEQANGSDPQIPQNLRSDVVFPLIRGKAQSHIGLQGVHTLFLELIGAELVDQSDAPAFLTHIEKNSSSLGINLFHGSGQLLSAVAAQRTKYISGEAFGMDAAENILSVTDFSFYQSDMMLTVQPVHISV